MCRYLMANELIYDGMNTLYNAFSENAALLTFSLGMTFLHSSF